jgi:hypothetical protein
MGSEEKIKIAMMTAASKALNYRKINPKADTEEIMQFIMSELKMKGQEKIGAMAAAGKALTYLEKEKLSDKQIMQKVMNDSEDILMTMSID